MIELGSKKRMVVAIAALAGLSVFIIILESTQLRSHQDDIHESHPLLKEKLKPEDKCWTTENYEIIEICEVCTKEEIFGHKPLVCVARGNKEKVRCDSGKEAFRSCDKVTRIEEQKFWIFEFVCAVIGALSASVVFLRQKQLDHKMYQKIQRQIAAGV
eukprot:GFUD01001527.1.p1 GENE.GFUD01001527.1~~GFUD01001527.1.p1  ORF type:complete len:158 (+),score=28.81 GFUD01001527.1:97-570(+)